MSKNNLNNILIFIIILLFMYCINEINKMKKINEQFTTSLSTTDDAIKTAVKQIYLADVEAIRILSNFAIQLTQGGTTVPGNVTFNENITISGSLKTNTISPSSSSIVNINGDATFKNSITCNSIKTNDVYLNLNDNNSKNYGMFFNAYVNAIGQTINDTGDRDQCNVSINSWNGLQFTNTCAADGGYGSKIWFSLRSGTMNSRKLNIVDGTDYQPEIILNGDNGEITCKGMVNSKPTAVNIDPNYSAIIFNNDANQLNKWIIRADNSNSLNFQGWNTTTNNWNNILSVNQDNIVSCDHLMSKKIGVGGDANYYGMTHRVYVDASGHTINDTGDRNRCNISINSWNGLQFTSSLGNDSKIWFDLRNGIMNSKILNIINMSTSEQKITLNGDNGKIICSDGISCTNGYIDTKNFRVLNSGGPTFSGQIATFDGWCDILFARATRTNAQANTAGGSGWLQVAIPLKSQEGFILEYLAKSSVNGRRRAGVHKWAGEGTTIIDQIAHEFGQGAIVTSCNINTEKTYILLSADWFATYLSAKVTFM